MNITDRLGAAWRAFTGKRDPYAATYGSGSGGGFAGAAVGRLTASLSSWSGSVNADLDASLVVMRARARALAANNEHGRRFLSLVAANVVGRANPKLQVRVMRPAQRGKPQELAKSTNDAVEIHWERWGRTADISGRHKSLYSLLRTAVKGAARDGEALIRKVRSRSLPYGLGLQLLEADRLDETMNARLQNGNVIRQGVELDGSLRAIAYYVKTSHPGETGFIPGRPGIERIPAEEMIHLFLPERAEQVRGYTWMHAIIIRGSVIHRFEEAAVVAAEIGASKVAALQRAEDATDAIGQMADGQVGNAMHLNVEAGELFELPPGYTLNSWNPEYPHANFDSFLKACLRGLAAGLDVAAHNLTGDMTDVNYSSARIAELAERETWMVLQDWLIDTLVMPVYEEWLAIALLQGQITFPSGDALFADKLDTIRNASRFQGRRWAWVDPSKEADAQEKLLANKLTSRTRIAAEQGLEIDDILDELAQEATMIEAAGLAPPPPAAPPVDNSVKDAALALLARSAEPQQPAPAPVFHFKAGDVRVEPAAITVEPAKVTVEPTPIEIRNEIITPEQPAPNVEVRVEAVMPEQAAPIVEVNVEMPEETRTTIVGMPVRETTTEIVRNGAGDIVSSKQVEQDKE